MSYLVNRGFLLVALLLTILNSSALAQGVANNTAAESRPQMAAATSVADNGRESDGLAGPVRRIRTELTKLSNKSGNTTEGQRVLMETASYDIKGTKLENAYYPVAGETLTGREVYKYDERGNISEMTLHAPDGSLISKETYTYEFDQVGNWTKMTTSVAVIEGGKVNFEPTEITYRTITYYLDANMAKMVQPASTTTPPALSSTPATKPNTDAKTEPKIAAAATNGNHATAPIKTQVASLPVANTLDKTNIIPASNRGVSSIPGGGVGMPASSSSNSGGGAIVKIEDTGEPPVKPLPKPLTKPVSGGVLNGQATELPKPEYPEFARRTRAAGMVNVEVVIDETGKIISARAVSGPPLLREAAVKAALRARFSPTKLSGQPVKISGLINYNFSLK